MALYHKYRPQTFNDLLLTQPEVAENFISALLKSATSHAYLFTGTHGTGKTSTARILAKAINCERNSELHILMRDSQALLPVPCNQCEACLTITIGSNMDVVEMDAASNRGIDEIRDLKERIRLAPVMLKHKVYIIDEVHMLTTEAFNALLKTLEEPPSHTVFVLCTTELHKVPGTIQSRCTHILFKRPTIDRIVALLSAVSTQENVTIDTKALQMIAQAARGAFS